MLFPLLLAQIVQGNVSNSVPSIQNSPTVDSGVSQTNSQSIPVNTQINNPAISDQNNNIVQTQNNNNNSGNNTNTAVNNIQLPPRGELHFSIGLQGGASGDWNNDGLGHGMINVGFRIYRVVMPFVAGSLGYARVDQRLLTRVIIGLGFGGLIRELFYPRAFVAFVHQHEESLASVAHEPAGALLGIGSGIRHRAGLYAGVGLDYVFFKRPTVSLTIGPEFSFMYLTYSVGPSWYFAGGINFATNVRLF